MYNSISKVINNSSNNKVQLLNVLFLFLFLSLPKSPFAIRMLALILKCFSNPNLTVSQPFTVLPTLLLHHTTSKALKGRDFRKLLMGYSTNVGVHLSTMIISHLSKLLKVSNSLTVPRSIFQSLPQPVFISHSDIVTSIHVTSVCKKKIWVKENLILQV